jgi:MOSC domain-containing protein YiiM
VNVRAAMSGVVVAVATNSQHRFSKTVVSEVMLIEGFGIDGDAHAGTTVKHRSRVARNPDQPNLRQVHLLQVELLDELRERGFPIVPGALGENVTTSGVDLLALPAGTLLHLGGQAVVRVTGLRNPCSQIEDFHEGLLAAVVSRDPNGHIKRKTGVMAVVLNSGIVRTNDPFRVELPPPPYASLEVV